MEQEGDNELLIVDDSVSFVSSSSISEGEGEDRKNLEDGRCLASCFPTVKKLWVDKWFLFFSFFYVFSETMLISGLFPVSITSIARQFGFKNVLLGALPSLFDGVVAFAGVTLSYIGKDWHRPRLLGITCLFLGLGALTMALPGILDVILHSNKYYMAAADGNDTMSFTRNQPSLLCSSNAQPDPCEGQIVNHSFSNGMYFLFLVGEALLGIGTAPIYVFVPSFFDDNVEPRKQSSYLSLFYLGSALGPALGFLLGGALLSSYVTLGEPPEGIDEQSSEWIGAWWLSFVICGCICFFTFPFFLSFPRHLPNTAWIRALHKNKGNITDNEGVNDDEEDATMGDDDKDLTGYSQPMLRLKQKDNDDEFFGDKKLTTSDGIHDLQHNNINNSNITEGDCMEINGGSNAIAKPSILQRMKEDARDLLTNPTFMGVALGNMIDLFIVSGMGTFLPAFVETQYHLTASDASFYSGVAIILGVTAGMVLGGFVMKWRRWSPRQTSFATIISAALCTLSVFVMFLTCSTLDLAGLTVPYGGNGTSSLILTSTTSTSASAPFTTTTTLSSSMYHPNGESIWEGCAPDCHCASRDYRAMCDLATTTTYFSACNAGCTVDLGNGKAFGNCSCVATQTDPTSNLGSIQLDGNDGLPTEHVATLFNVVIPGKCTAGCNELVPFLCLVFVTMALLFFNSVPITHIHLRCVKKKHRNLALAFANFLARLVGAVPAPIIMGSIIDNSCLLWEVQCDGSTGACEEYENPSMAKRMFAVLFISKLLSVLFYFWGWLKFPKHRDVRLEDERQHEHETVEPERTSSGRNGGTSLRFNDFAEDDDDIDVEQSPTRVFVIEDNTALDTKV
eukprot:m.44024 g.44024  ORF g.44024 m.44024 type:complete len:848 (+) comp10579_c0_seq1:71-2614(+)